MTSKSKNTWLGQSPAWASRFDSPTGRGIDEDGIDYDTYQEEGNNSSNDDYSDDDETASVASDNELGDVLTTFLSPLAASNLSLRRKDNVRRFCEEAAQKSGPNAERSNTKVVLIDECDIAGSIEGGINRVCGLGSTAEEFIQHIISKRCGVSDRGECKEAEARSKTTIRRQYFDGLNANAIYALGRTASDKESAVLPHFIDAHLAQVPTTTVKGEILGLESDSFALQFHIPYVVWRPHKKVQEDKRTLRGDPLRTHVEITFLDGSRSESSNKPFDFLYEATVSCLILGTSSTEWVAYLFADTYHEEKGTEESRSVNRYIKKRAKSSSQPDPFTLGQTLAGEAVRDARVYWLTVYRWWITRISDEWALVVDHLDGVQKRLNYHHLKKKRDELKEFLVRVPRMLAMLSTSAHAFEDFHARNRDLFIRPENKAPQNGHARSRNLEVAALKAIRIRTDAMKQYKVRLELTHDRLSTVSRRIDEEELLDNSTGNMRLATTTSNLNSTMVTIAILTVMCLPVSITSSVMSIPGIWNPEPNPKLFAGLTVLVMTLFVIIYKSVEKWVAIRKSFPNAMKALRDWYRPTKDEDPSIG